MTMLEKVEVMRMYQMYKNDVLEKLLEIIKNKHCRECESIDTYVIMDKDISVTYCWKCCGVYTYDTVDIPIALLADDRDIQVDTKTEGVV